jgi:hypothetical protein
VRSSGKIGVVADNILELQRAFDDAELRGDADRLDALLADDFRSIGEQGYQLGKREWIDRHRDFRYLPIQHPRLRLNRRSDPAAPAGITRSRANVLSHPTFRVSEGKR